VSPSVRGRRAPRRDRPEVAATMIPSDPAAGTGPLDPAIAAIRAGLVPYRRRLWLRRVVRRALVLVALVLVAEVVLWATARLIPLDAAPAVGAILPALGAVALMVLTMVARPSIGETAIAVDGEGGLRDRLTSALALAETSAAAPPSATDPSSTPEPAREWELIQRQRRDAVGVLMSAPHDLFRPRARRGPLIAAAASTVLLVPLLLLPNAMDLRIAQDRTIR